MAIRDGDTTGAMTGDRRVTIDWDIDEYALTRPAWSCRRMYGQVASAAAADKAIDSAQAVNLYHWASGCWTLRPLELRPWRVQEKESPGVLSATPTDAVPGNQVPMFRGASGTGFSPASDNAPDGNDLFFRKTIEAGTSWNLASVLSAPSPVTDHSGILSAPPVVLAEPQPKSAQPLDPILQVTDNAAPNAPIYLRVQVPGTGLLNFQYLGTLHWAQYALTLCGDGMAELWEHATKVGAGSATWQKRASFRYSRPDLVSGNTHTMVIFPHVGVNFEKYVSFASAQMDAPGLLSAQLVGSREAGAPTTGEYLYKWDEVLTNSVDITHATYDTGDDYGVSKYISTIGGPIWVTERRDLRNSWQVGHAHFEAAGVLTDLSASQPDPAGGVVTVETVEEIRGSTTLTTRILDATTDTVWSGTGDTPSPMRLRFELLAAPDGLNTPLLWGYQLRRAAVTTLMSPGAFTTSYTDLDLQQGTREAADEGGSVTVMDAEDAYPRLRSRGELSVRVSTTYTPPGDTEKTVRLFRGFAVQPGRDRIGQADRQWDFPSAQWGEYSANFVGMWKRLTSESATLKTAMKLSDFASDPTDIPAKRPWKVTDAIRYLLGAAGFPSGMLAIHDIDLRLNPGIGTSGSDLYLDGQVSIGDTVVKLARSYLGMFLVFAPSAGTHGKWKLIGAPATDADPVLHFVRGYATPTGSSATFQLPMTLAGFPAATVPIFRRPHSHVVPPEANHLWLCNKVDTGGGMGLRMENHLHNYLSYKVPGSTVDPDPDSPHYLPCGERLLMVNDQSLWAGAGAKTLGYDATQRVIDYHLMRLFFSTCLAREIKTFDAPLLPILDAADTAYRLPRFYDPCTYLSVEGWYVRHCSPHFTKDHLQMASYQIERIVPYQPEAA